MQGYWGALGALLWKELLSEWRTREVVNSSLVFALMVLIVFNFSFDLRVENAAAVAPGALWVTFIFASVLALGRGFARERDRGTLDGLLLAPLDRSVVYLAKLLANVLFITLVELVTLPVFVVLFNLPIAAGPAALTALLGAVGFASVGTLFAAMAANTRAREVMLPVLLFPIALPVIIATVKATGAALGVAAGDTSPWLGILAAFDAIFLALSLVVFEYVIEE